MDFKLKPIIAAEAKEKQAEYHGNQYQSAVPQIFAEVQTTTPHEKKKNENDRETNAQIAEKAGVSRETIRKVEKIEAQATPEIKAALRSGDLSINAAYNKVQQAKRKADIQQHNLPRMTTRLRKERIMLIEHSLFGSTDKVADAINLLRQHEPKDGYYLCFSGGKDSVVIYDLAVRAGVKFDAHHNITTVEPPELLKFIKREYPLVVNEHPTTTMHKLIVKHHMPPLRTARYCCAALKERGGIGRVKITGIRSEESPRRAKRKQVEEDKRGGKFVHVVKDWSTADIWQYIRLRGLPYCRLYDEGFERIGCVLCPFQNFSAVQRDMARFPSVVDYYRRACRASFAANKDTIRKWTSGDDMFNWWIQNRRGRYVADDCNSIPLFSEDDGWIL